ncbi:hypothetical protein CKM354_001204800 [Cercospora kikuchii]|uniref:Alpha/beta hydrolase fold-3 domain-containing protein n=1 Tax=Cercospora kikuchii TaxID=84275 RepID=A0A9P3FKN3_9PEZI|nr:uncharacterized protein CKM354_001204800 [Cercospora kikuchii]GIZ49007.1 hypothetical protein CKM354_001204800 [Cercospora kikuchii]
MTGRHHLFVRLVVDILLLPAYILAICFPNLRPSSTWSWRQALRVRVVRIIVQTISLKRTAFPLSNEPGLEGDRFELIAAANPRSYVEICNINEEVRPQPTGATWFPTRLQNAREARKVVIHFHGGAYVLGDGRDKDAGFAARTLLESCGGNISHIVCPQYRLVSAGTRRFPAALQDAVTCYAYIIRTRGVDPQDVVVSGDSAGGHLALGLIRYLEQFAHTVDLPVPSNLWLWSPWVGPGFGDSSDHDLCVRAKTDYTTAELGNWCVDLVRSSVDLENPYIQVLGNPYRTSARIFICAGEFEVFLDDNILLAEQMRGIQNNVVETFIIPNAPHDVLLMGDKVGFEYEAKMGALAAAKTLLQA